MQWIEVTVKTTSAAIELVAERLTVLGFDSFIIDDQEEFHEFLDQNRQYWDYVDEELERQMTGLSQIRLYLEDGPAAPETVSQLRDQLSALRAQYPRVAEAPFDSERKRMSTLHADGSSVVQYTKGAPDVLLPLCDRIWIDGRAEPMTDAHRAEIAHIHLRRNLGEGILRVQRNRQRAVTQDGALHLSGGHPLQLLEHLAELRRGLRSLAVSAADRIARGKRRRVGKVAAGMLLHALADRKRAVRRLAADDDAVQHLRDLSHHILPVSILIAVAQDHIGRRKAHAAIHALAEAPKLALFPEPVYQPRLAQPCFVDPKLRRTALRTEGAVQLRPVEIAASSSALLRRCAAPAIRPPAAPTASSAQASSFFCHTHSTSTQAMTLAMHSSIKIASTR